MDPWSLPPYLYGIGTRADAAADPAVLAMAHTFERALKRNLSLQTRGVEDFRPRGERGQIPALRTGRLRASVKTAGPSGGRAEVAPHTIYASVQEWGFTMHARPNGYMHFISGGEWFLKTVNVGPNPYMRPTIRQCITNGSLTRAGMEAFRIAVWGR